MTEEEGEEEDVIVEIIVEEGLGEEEVGSIIR